MPRVRLAYDVCGRECRAGEIVSIHEDVTWWDVLVLGFVQDEDGDTLMVFDHYWDCDGYNSVFDVCVDEIESIEHVGEAPFGLLSLHMRSVRDYAVLHRAKAC